MDAMTAQLRETYQSKETEELIELGGKTTLTETAYSVLEEVLVSRAIDLAAVRASRTQTAESERLEEEALSRLASIPKRFIAKLIDTWGILLFAGLLLGILTGIGLPDLSKKLELVVVFAYALYFFLKDGLTGQSLGKRVMKIKVVRYDTNKPCTLGQSIWRNLSGILFFDWFFALGKKRMRLGDMIANTQVVKANYKMDRNV
jgi:uncharacterized RDD family membrane protein YckC